MALVSYSDLADVLHSLAQTPMLLAALIVLASFILEDAATIAAALLAAQGYIDPTLSLSALFFGIIVGDIGLYTLGRYVSNHPGAMKWAGEKRLKRGRDWMHHRLAPALIGARFLPGMRLPTYIASGFLKVSFFRFTLIAIGAVTAWTGIIFAMVYHFGPLFIDRFGQWAWALGAVLVLIAIFVPRRLERHEDEDVSEE
jgi:membrane protein DedA with SNARE-associated domain